MVIGANLGVQSAAHRKKKRSLMFSVTAADCIWTYYRGSGKGGQKRNKTDNCVRVQHEPSGAMAYSEDGRSKQHNKVDAFKKMVNTLEFKVWHKLKIDAYMDQVDIEEPNEQGTVVKRKLRGDEV